MEEMTNKHGQIKVWFGVRNLLGVCAGVSMAILSPVCSSMGGMQKPLAGHTVKYAQNTFIYNPRTLTWKAIKNGKVVKTGRGSGGRNYCPDIKRACRTPSGTYRIISKRGASCRSSRYPKGKGGAPMPYCMFYSKYYAVHGSPNVPNYNASHGCIRVKTSAARWLYNNFMTIGTKVVVKPY